MGTELNESQNRHLQALLEVHDKVIWMNQLTSTKIEHRINLVDEEPVISTPYPLPYALRLVLKDEIKEMLDMEIVSSPYALSVIIVKKKVGLNRGYLDYRNLNKLTISDPDPIKTSKSLFQKLEKSQFFSKIDLSKGYWKISVV